MDISRAWGTIIENMKFAAKEKLRYYEMKKYIIKGSRKLDRLQWLRAPSELNVKKLKT
jgi:hypothetical protein